MAASATVTLKVSTTENPGGFTWPGEKSFTNAAPPLLADLMNLSAVLVAVTIPAGTEWIIIVPPSTNANNLLVAGANVAGAAAHPTRPIYWPSPPAGAVMFLGATGAVNNVQIYFI